jgi:hypothetical protein
MKRLTVVLGLLLMAGFVGAATAGECRSNNWQPTFVRHNSVAPTVYYYTGTTFIPMASPAQAQQTCKTQGVREPINGQTCWQRNWGDFGCGCNITPARNNTCRAFQNFLRQRP